jgi:ADP-heptose:LPS heptosyltransferase
MNDGWQIVFTGSAEEIPLVEAIRDELTGETLSLAGQLTLSELAAVIEQAPLLLTNNTGPSHIAAAVGTPVVTLYALTNPQHTPWQVPSVVLSHDVPCRNCFKSVCPEGHNHCLALIEPRRVAEACVHLFDTTHEPFHGEAYAHTGN